MTRTKPPFRVYVLSGDIATKGPVPESAKTTVAEAWTREAAWEWIEKHQTPGVYHGVELKDQA